MTEDTKRRGLGRGLDALLGEESALPESSMIQHTLPTASLVPGRFQPRQHFDEEALDSLAASIAEHGILQPLLVRSLGNDTYEIVAGERRWRAAQRAHLHEVPVIIRDLPDAKALEIGLIENLQRADLDSIEEAKGYDRLIKQFGHTAVTVAKVLGKSRPHVSNTLRLLTLPSAVQEMLQEGALTPSHARALMVAPDPVILAAHVVQGGLSVRETERVAARAMRGQSFAPPAERARDATGIESLEECLEMYTGMVTRVRMGPLGNQGSVTLRFSELGQLEALIKRLSIVPPPSVLASGG